VTEHRLSRLAAALVLVAASLPPRPARAQSPQNLQVAQALYDQATQEMAAKSYATACPKLEEAVRLVPEGVGGKLTLAECYEAQGKLASAWAAYELAEAAASRARQLDRQKLAHERGEALRPRVAMLTIAVAEPARSVPGLSIKRDGVSVGPAQWGVPLPADRGKHLIVASVGDGRTWERTIEITTDGARETVGIGELPGAPAPPSGPVVGPAAGPLVGPAAGSAPPPVAPPEAPSSARRTAGIVVASAGGVGLAVGLALGAVALTRKGQSNADGHCDAQNHCDPTGTDLRLSSLKAGNWSTALFVGGAAVLAGGVVIVATAPSAAAAPSTGARSFKVGLTAGGLVVSGGF
jgi:hypothetical protein